MTRFFVFALCLAYLTHVVAASETEKPKPRGYENAAKAWVESEFNVSTLSPAQQMDEMRWFIQAAQPFRGMTIRVVSERIETHSYESNVLARAFSDITGINVVHELTGEDDVVKKLQTQIQTGVNLYDAYINDSDLIGYHYRSGETVILSDYMLNEGKHLTLPTLDLDDFMGISFTEGPDGRLYQLPDQQFANLYWYRHDWFSRPDLQQQFKKLYGYELGVPRNWSAYEDIAEFFSIHIKEIDGERVWGHMDYARTDPSLGWRMSDAWLSMAGAGDKGLPNGIPVDEWGIRVIGCQPVGASVKRGGALDSPAAIYAVTKFVEWLDKYAPPEAKGLNFTEAGTWVSKGNIAQQIFWYTGFTTSLTNPDLPIVNDDGTPRWRMAPSPHGAYWEAGMKLGYQDAGSWTLLKNTPAKRRDAAWLYAQFVVSKTVSLQKTLKGLTPIRISDIESSVMTERAPYLGGLVEFYRSKGRNVWTPTGTNVPDYARLSNFWWQFVSLAVEGKETVANAMHKMAEAMDLELAQIANESELHCKPVLNDIEPEEVWLKREGAPKAKRYESPRGITSSYEEAIRAWQ